MSRIINRDRSVIPACDVDLETFRGILEATADVEGVGGYKIGFFLVLEHGLKDIVGMAKQYAPDKPVIYDHQKAGTDIPDTGARFAEVCANAGVDAVILFPQSGPETEYAWISAAQGFGLDVIVGGEMTHLGYLESDTVGEAREEYAKFEEIGFEMPSGFLRMDAPEEMYEIAARMGVTDFVVPGNKPDAIRHYRSIIEGCGVAEPAFYSPGLVTQGGDISEGAEAAGDRFHAIVGRGIYEAEDMRKAALEHSSKL